MGRKEEIEMKIQKYKQILEDNEIRNSANPKPALDAIKRVYRIGGIYIPDLPIGEDNLIQLEDYQLQKDAMSIVKKYFLNKKVYEKTEVVKVKVVKSKQLPALLFFLELQKQILELINKYVKSLAYGFPMTEMDAKEISWNDVKILPRCIVINQEKWNQDILQSIFNAVGQRVAFLEELVSKPNL